MPIQGAELEALITTKAEEYCPKVLSKPGREDYRKTVIDIYKQEIAYVMETREVNSIDDLSSENWRSINVFAWPRAMEAIGEIARKKREEKAAREARAARKLKPGDTTNLEINQGMREAEVLGVIGDEAIVEYSMPKGTTALIIVDAYDWYVKRNVSYKNVPDRWLQAMLNAGSEWIARPQGSIQKRYGTPGNYHTFILRYHVPSIEELCESRGIVKRNEGFDA